MPAFNTKAVQFFRPLVEWRYGKIYANGFRVRAVTALAGGGLGFRDYGAERDFLKLRAS